MLHVASGESRPVLVPTGATLGSRTPPQEPVSRPRGNPSGSWSLKAPEGAYGPVVAWTSGAAWFDALMDALSTQAGEMHRRAAHVALGTLLRVARADWLSADVATGRGVATAHETVAADLGMCGKTVQRARGLMEALGFSVTIEEGRYLTRAERAAARAAHGGRQVRAASLRALTLPKPAAVENVQLPRRGEGLKTSHLKKYFPTRASARKAAASRPLAKKPKYTIGTEPPPDAPRSVAMQRFAAGLVDGDSRDGVSRRRMPWLLNAGREGRAVHIGALCDVLAGAGVDPTRWKPRELVETIDAWHESQGRRTLAGRSHDPLRYFAWQLRMAFDPARPTPSEEIEIRRSQRAAERARQANEREEQRHRMRPDDLAEFDRISAQMRADMKAEQRARRLRQ